MKPNKPNTIKRDQTKSNIVKSQRRERKMNVVHDQYYSLWGEENKLYT